MPKLPFINYALSGGWGCNPFHIHWVVPKGEKTRSEREFPAMDTGQRGDEVTIERDSMILIEWVVIRLPGPGISYPACQPLASLSSPRGPVTRNVCQYKTASAASGGERDETGSYGGGFCE